MNGFEAMAKATKDNSLRIRVIGDKVNLFTPKELHAYHTYGHLLEDDYEVIKQETNLDKAVEGVYQHFNDPTFSDAFLHTNLKTILSDYIKD